MKESIEELKQAIKDWSVGKEEDVYYHAGEDTLAYPKISNGDKSVKIHLEIWGSFHYMWGDMGDTLLYEKDIAEGMLELPEMIKQAMEALRDCKYPEREEEDV